MNIFSVVVLIQQLNGYVIENLILLPKCAESTPSLRQLTKHYNNVIKCRAVVNKDSSKCEGIYLSLEHQVQENIFLI